MEEKIEASLISRIQDRRGKPFLQQKIENVLVAINLLMKILITPKLKM